MCKIAAFLIMAIAALSWHASAHARDDMQSAIDTFLAREQTKIELARKNLAARTDASLRLHYQAEFEKYAMSATPLHRAAQDGNLAGVEALIRTGADVNATMGAGTTPLEMATLFNRLGVMECLLRNGADPDAGATPPLWEAAAVKRLPAMRLLLRYGADPNRENSVGATPLFAIFINPWLIPQTRIMEGLELLLDAGADAGIEKKFQPLYSATAFGYRDAERLLLESGAKPLEAGAYTEPNVPELHRAAREGNLARVRTLVQNGANVNQPDGVRGLPPVLYAVKSGHLDVFEWLAGIIWGQYIYLSALLCVIWDNQGTG